MRASIILSFILLLLGCSNEHNKPSSSSCSDLYIDKRSRASNDFVTFRENVKKAGFLFPQRDTTLYPFTKRLFFAPRLSYLRDTLRLDDCSIFDSVNIHYFDLLSTKPSVAADYPELRLEEEQFKDRASCDMYRKSLAIMLKQRTFITKPTGLLQFDNRLYIFQATDYKQTDELTRLLKLLDPSLKGFESNF